MRPPRSTAGVPALWIAEAKSPNPRLLTRGLDDQGADQPRWLPGPEKGQTGSSS